jgi:predicted nucleic acid-binding protein
LIVSAALLDDSGRALGYPKLRRRIPEEDAERVLQWLSKSAPVVVDPTIEAPVCSADPGDDYLIALASAPLA